MLARRHPFVLAFAHLNSARPAVEADAIHVVHYHRPVVVVVNHRDVDVGNRAVVLKSSSAPFAAIETYTRVAIPIINSTIEAHVRSPVTGVPQVNAFRKTPITRRPKKANFRRHHPCSGHPIISVVAISPISRSPDIARGGANWLLINRQHRRSYAD